MRIVGGTARGRPLEGPQPGSDKIRPTSDRVRETLFNVLGQSLDPIEVLDLFSGTGALALEALSRGAERALLVDSGAEAVALAHANASALGFESRIEVWRVPAARALETLKGQGRRFPLVFADPPYAARFGIELLEQVAPVLAPAGLLVLEHDKREELPEAHAGLTREDERAFGDTRISLYRA